MLNTIAMANLLKGEYKEAFEKIDLYGSMGNIDNDIYEDRMTNLYDMFIQAQSEEKPVDKIIGDDIEMFCKKYFTVEDKGHKLGKFFGSFGWIMTLTFIYSIIELAIDVAEGNSFMKSKIDLFPIALGLVVGFILMAFGKFVNKFLTFKKNKAHPIVYYIIVLVLFVTGIIGGVSVLGDKVDINLPLYIVLIVSGILAVGINLAFIIISYKKNGTLKNLDREDKRIKKEFEEEVAFKGGLKDVASGMAFRYKRLKKKKAKKGIEFTQADYAKHVQKDIDAEKAYNIFAGVCIVIFVIGPALSEAIAGNMMLAAIHFAIMGLVGVFTFRWFLKFNKEQNESYRVILAECEEKGIDVVEYYEQYK